MWIRIAHIILKYRIFLLLILAVVTGVMAHYASQVKMTFKLAELVPQSNPEMQYFKAFKKKYGEDANVLVIGFKDSSLFEIETFGQFNQLCQDLNAIKGIEKSGVIALPTLQYIDGYGSSRNRKFRLKPVFDSTFFAQDLSKPSDSLQQAFTDQLGLVNRLKVFDGRVLNAENGATAIMVPIKEEYVNSKRRQKVVTTIQEVTDQFVANSKIEQAHFAGLPYVRTVMSGKVAEELGMFLWLSLGVTALILMFFFRSIFAVIFPLIVIGVAVIWSMGSIVIFGYQISLLTGLIPPIIVVIGIPNCVYLLNKYHHEFVVHNNKIKALSRVVRRIGIVTFITNCTTAIGFLVLTFADITILKEFGLVAGFNVFATFFISIILIPVVFSFLPPPNEKQLKHLDFKVLNKVLEGLDSIVLKRRKWVFTTTVLLVGVCLWGSWKVYGLSYMVDDIPDDNQVKKDLHFFEANFDGVMPLEILVRLEDKDDFKNLDVLRKIDAFESFLVEQKVIAKPISLITFVKAANQAYWGNDTAFYALPTDRAKGSFSRFLRKSQTGDFELQDSKLVDTTGIYRISLKMADIGSKKMDSLIKKVIIPAADRIFESDKPYESYATIDSYEEAPYRITGTTLLFIKGTKYLIWNLRESLIIAIVLISMIMAVLFRNFRMIILSLITNLIPLAITGALMGFLDIPLKPSTALIFSIAFGISVDDSIHFLAKYRQELFLNNFHVQKSISNSIKETGSSMIYTSIVLFFGFIIFTASNFEGTKMLGLLTATTLFCAMITNLVLLPALIIQFDSGKRRLDAKPFIDAYNKSQSDGSDRNDEEEMASKPVI